MKIFSPAFEDNGSLPSTYTCDGSNVNPPLSFTDVPTNAQSLALIVEDPDATSGDFTHWVVWNLDPNTRQISENAVTPESTEGINDFGKTGYGGACPPSGEHRYIFKLYALDAQLDLPTNSKKEDLLEAMETHILEQTQLVAKYARQ